MTSAFSWVDLVSLVVAFISLGVTAAIFFVGRRLSFRQQRERTRELEALAWKILRPIRLEGLNSKIIVMNVARYKRGYKGSNSATGGRRRSGPATSRRDMGTFELCSSFKSRQPFEPNNPDNPLDKTRAMPPELNIAFVRQRLHRPRTDLPDPATVETPQYLSIHDTFRQRAPSRSDRLIHG